MALNRPYESMFDDSSRLVVGGFADVKLWRPLSLEVDGLYRRTGSEAALGGVKLGNQQNIWDFPVLIKAGLTPRGSAIRPFLSGGYVLRAYNNKMEGMSGSGGVMTFSETKVYHGGAAGGGVEFKVGRFAIVPEYRYSRFERFRSGDRNVHDFLVGFRF